MKLVWLLGLFLLCTVVSARDFSAYRVTESVADRYRILSIPSIKANQFSFANDYDKTVLKITSQQSASSVAIPIVSVAASKALLTWRWKVSNVVASADMRRKNGEDFAARVYVFFDVPLESLSFIERSKIRLARMMSGADVPTAAICYVWDNQTAIETIVPSAFTNRVRMIVLQSGDKKTNAWVSQSRDVAADFERAFGHAAPVITGVAVGSDTDQTGETVTTWFGDVKFKSRPDTQPTIAPTP
jgi:Protein of unknown function (DUF3047)